jgi:hypothetical protein
MTDVYVYYFSQIGPTGIKVISNRRATLDAIGRIGEAVMESQIVVDHTEVDDNGFVIGHTRDDSHPMDALGSQIISLERRANSRDNETPTLSERSEAQNKYMLSLESRELRKQAQALRKQRSDSLTAESRDQIGAPGSEPCKYLSLEGVVAAINNLVQLQHERGFATTADANDRGDLVG